MVRATKIFSVMEASWMPIKTFLKKHVTKGVINEQHAKSMYLKQNSLQNHVKIYRGSTKNSKLNALVDSLITEKKLFARNMLHS